MRKLLLPMAFALLLATASCSEREQTEQPKGFSTAEPGPNMRPPASKGAASSGSIQAPPPGGIPDEDTHNSTGAEQPVYADPADDQN